LAAKKKPTPAEIELQLSERRFLLEAVQTGAQLLQVPIITAFVWAYLSRTNTSLGVLNKAILAAEMTPLIGDIKFPEGVLLGAAMESTDDMLDILGKAGLLDTEKIKQKVVELQEDTGDLIADQIIRIIPDQECVHWLAQMKANQPSFGSKFFTFKTVDWFIALKKLKAQGCEQPGTVSDKLWQKV